MIFHLILLIFGTFALCASLFAYRKSKFKWALILLITGGFLLRLFVATDDFLHPWDERYHALVAKNMISSPFVPKLYDNPVLSYDYTNWTGNHIWVHKQPFPLWLMAASMKVFGTNEVAIRIPSLLLSTFS